VIKQRSTTNQLAAKHTGASERLKPERAALIEKKKTYRERRDRKKTGSSIALTLAGKRGGNNSSLASGGKSQGKNRNTEICHPKERCKRKEFTGWSKAVEKKRKEKSRGKPQKSLSLSAQSSPSPTKAQKSPGRKEKKKKRTSAGEKPKSHWTEKTSTPQRTWVKGKNKTQLDRKCAPTRKDEREREWTRLQPPPTQTRINRRTRGQEAVNKRGGLETRGMRLEQRKNAEVENKSSQHDIQKKKKSE